MFKTQILKVMFKTQILSDFLFLTRELGEVKTQRMQSLASVSIATFSVFKIVLTFHFFSFLE